MTLEPELNGTMKFDGEYGNKRLVGWTELGITNGVSLLQSTSLILERYYLFLVQFDLSEPKIPPPSSWDTFVAALKTGTKLCVIHNALTHFSLRPFGLITRYHTDTSVQYRVTENLRYFAKAAEIRWDVQIEWDVEEIWRSTPKGLAMFKLQLSKWCESVTKEMGKIYHEEMAEGEDVLDELLGELGSH
jgi:hypothetical protein